MHHKRGRPRNRRAGCLLCKSTRCVGTVILGRGKIPARTSSPGAAVAEPKAKPR